MAQKTNQASLKKKIKANKIAQGKYYMKHGKLNYKTLANYRKLKTRLANSKISVAKAKRKK